ncbi:MAG: hypothetical protein ACHQIO_00680, partial [Nevskiales bacterium]
MSSQARHPGASRGPGAANSTFSILLLLLSCLLTTLPARAQELIPASGDSGEALDISVLTIGP